MSLMKVTRTRIGRKNREDENTSQNNPEKPEPDRHVSADTVLPPDCSP